LISPWASFWTDYPGFAHEIFGVVAPDALRKWNAMRIGRVDPVGVEVDSEN
jgi:hypothetical protein